MTSLQKEEFFEFVATTQARRLDDQRAQLERSSPPKTKARSFRGSIKQLSFVKKPEKPAPVPVPAPKEDLYNMILTTQVSDVVSVNVLLRHKEGSDSFVSHKNDFHKCTVMSENIMRNLSVLST